MAKTRGVARLFPLRNGESGAELDAEKLWLYDRTFAERIGWKWDAVLRQALQVRWWPKTGTVLAWGRGTGIALRWVAVAIPRCERYYLFDWSGLARQFSIDRVKSEGRDARPGIPEENSFLLLLSHVLGELTERAASELAKIIERAQAVIWVEPGNHSISRLLSGWRNRLGIPVAAPCTHQKHCEMFLEKNGIHWCHFFCGAAGGTLSQC